MYRVGLAIVAFGLAAGCTSAVRSETGRDGASLQPVVIDVTNEQLVEVRVFLVRGDTRRPLGEVSAQDTHRFVVPGRLVQGLELRLGIQLVHESALHATDPVLAVPGERLSFVVGNNLLLSGFRNR